MRRAHASILGASLEAISLPDRMTAVGALYISFARLARRSRTQHEQVRPARSSESQRGP
jgi:hypothetical protein